MKQIKGLDTLRAFAVFFVIIDHWGPNYSDLNPFFLWIKENLIPDGEFGVNLFFVLSGFLITSILLDARFTNNEENRMFILKNFFIRRALRIFPIYYLMILILFLIKYDGLIDNIWGYLTYTINIVFYSKSAWGAIPHTWSLAVEEQFYLFWPWIILFINKKYLKYVFIVAIATGIISSYITSVMLGKGNQPILLYNCLGCFGLGGYYSFMRINKEKCKSFEKYFYPLFFICFIIFIHWKATRDDFWGQTTFLFRMIDGVISLQLIISVFNNKSNRIRKYLLENKSLNYIGKISYGIYLYHYALQPIFDGYRGRFMLRHPNFPQIFNDYYFSYGCKLVLLFLIASFSYKFIELPLLRLKKHFEYNKESEVSNLVK